jgi:hypothetical protein
MQHTFAGLLPAEPHGDPLPETRRSVVGRMMGFAASLAGIAWTRRSQAAENVSSRVTSMALGEEGGRSPSPPPKPPAQPRPTTLAVGEEGGGTVTTQAVGEEGGRPSSPPPKPPAQPRPTTLAVGEEGGGTSAKPSKPPATNGGSTTPLEMLEMLYGDLWLD